MLFSQGSSDGVVLGGQLLFFWSTGTGIRMDSSSPDGGMATRPAAAATFIRGTGGPIGEANWGGNDSIPLPDAPRVTTFVRNVTLADFADPGFGTVSDLDVFLNASHPNLDQVSIRLLTPVGNFVLVRNKTTNMFGALPLATGLPLGTTNLGQGAVSTVFDDDALRNIVTGSGSYAAHFQPEVGNFNALNGLAPANLVGAWTLEITDHYDDDRAVGPAPTQSVTSWGLHVSSRISTTGFGTGAAERNVTGVTTVPGAPNNVYPLMTAASGPAGIGPSMSVAIDNSVGASSPYAGTIYIGYTGDGGTDTNVYLARSTDFGATWQRVKVNDDSVNDGFSEGNRPQFLPAVAVDPLTGAVVVTYYDGRYDAAMARVANSLTASIDGGATFSPSAFLSPFRTATDAITLQTVNIEPIPGNQGQAGPLSFGDRQGLAVYGGRVVPAYSSNLNTAGASIMTARASIAAGPRIVQGDMGPITADYMDVVAYNNTFAADGTRRFDGFVVTFDRPIDPVSFDITDVVLRYLNPSTGVTTDLSSSIIAITPLDQGAIGATKFLVRVAPQSGVGTYSYAVGPNIVDTTRRGQFSITPLAPLAPIVATDVPYSMGGTPLPDTVISAIVGPTLPVGQVIYDLRVNVNINHTATGDLVLTLIAPDGTRVLLANGRGGAGDNFTNTTFSDAGSIAIAAAAAPFMGTFQPEQSLSNLMGKSASGMWQLEVKDTNVALNDGTLLEWSLTFTPATVVSSVTAGNLMDQNSNGVTGEPSDQFSAPGSKSGIPFTLPYTTDTLPLVLPGPHMVSSSVPNQPASSDNLVLNGSTNALDVVFDRDIQSASFTAANVLRITGPGGPITSYQMTTPATIPDLGTLTSTLVVTDSLAVSNLTVGINITHDRVSDLQVALIAPDGTTVPLFANIGGVGANVGTIIDGAAAASLVTAVAPFTGSFRPAPGSLAALNEKNYLGTWKLVVKDTVAGITGTLNGWSLNPVTITANPAGTPAPLANRTFRIGFPTQSVSGTYSVEIGPDSLGNYIQDLNGNRVDANLNAGVNLLRGGDPNNGTILPITFASGAVNTPLPPSLTVNSIINVTSNFLVQGATLTLNLQHQNIPDLEATLIAPDGTSVRLFTGVGTTGSVPHANFTGTVFDDAASAPIQLAVTVPIVGIGAGPFTPELPLSTFKNHASLGNWTLSITSNSSTLSGTLLNWSMTLKNSVPGSGLGEPVADRFAPHFRIFAQDPTATASQQSWTAVGPASVNNGATSGRIGGIAVDLADPSGNTVYVSGASGGVWKTTNFLTTDPNGPTYLPLTDFGPSTSLNTGSIAIFNRNNDPSQSIVFVATGEGDANTPGVGFLRSMDGGRTWQVLDSTTNVSAGGNVLAMSDPARDHAFVGATAFKVIVDPKAQTNGHAIVYAALSGPGGGIWRSTDTGGHWTRLQAGNATDVVLAAGSADASGNLQVLYAGLQGLGVCYSTNAPTTLALVAQLGGQGVPIRRDLDNSPDTEIPVGNLGASPTGGGRIVLGVPSYTGNPLQDALYQGWVYAVVVTPAGTLSGVYLSKDFGFNWTKVRIPAKLAAPTDPVPSVPTNDDTVATDYDVVSSPKLAQGNYNVAFTVDPNNPNISYLGGSSIGNPYGVIRIDVTRISDPYALVAYDYSNNDGGLTDIATTGAVTITPASPGPPAVGPGLAYGLLNANATNTTGPKRAPYYNLVRDPGAPFLTPSSLKFHNVAQFNNDGSNTTWMPFEDFIGNSTNQHEFVAYRDPLTGQTRLIFGNDNGVWTGVAEGDGTISDGIGSAPSVRDSRNGNLQLTSFYYGAAQPSTLAAELAGALFYGMSPGAGLNQYIGLAQSAQDILRTGNLNWTSKVDSEGTGVATDQTGQGTLYQFKWPSYINQPPFLASDFFQVTYAAANPISRTTGLLQAGDDPANNVGQWPEDAGSNFAVNPIDPTAIVISSAAGRVFRTAGPALGTGVQWFPIADPSDLDSTYAPALAFGSPSLLAPAVLNDFIYAGTTGGKIFVTFTGGGVGTPWTDISTGLDGSPVHAIVASPTCGSRAAYAVTDIGVYYTPDSGTTTWVNITGNLFSPGLARPLYNDPDQRAATLLALTSIVADWRYAIPDDLAVPLGPTHPVLYVGGDGGVFRSLDKGLTWTYFPDVATDGAGQIGGNLPSALITDLDLSLGNINPANGQPSQTTGLNLLQATTAGRGVFVIRLNDSILLANGQPLRTYALSPGVGPHVVDIAAGVTNAVDQWASAVIDFSSQRSATNGSASRATGVPDTLAYGDLASAWSPSQRNGDPQPLTVGFSSPAIANGVTIREANGNGFVRQIDLVDVNNVNHTIWAGSDTSQPGAPVDFTVNFPATTYLVKGVKIYVDGDHDQSTWEEIDAVRLLVPVVPAGALPGITVTFSGPVDPMTFTTADVATVTDPTGTVVPVMQINDITPPIGVTSLHNIYEILFAAPVPAFGFYHVTFGPRISDSAGNQMDQNQNFINGETVADVFSGRFLFQPFANNAPVVAASIVAPFSATFPAVDEDTTSPTGADLPSFLAGLPLGAITDPDDAAYAPSTAPRGIAVTSVDNTHGVWQYSTDGGATWNSFGAPTTTAARLLEVVANNRIRFVPSPGYSIILPPSPSFRFRAWDLTSGLAPLNGTDGGTANTTFNGGSTAFSSAQATAVITVTPSNDAPSFAGGSNVTVPEDAGAQSIAWASNMLAYPALPAPPCLDEAGQVLTFVVTQTASTGGLTFATAPVIDAITGNLTFQAAPDSSGTATFSVVLVDDGLAGPAPNVSTSTTGVFTITVTPSNDAPTFTLAGNPSASDEDAGAQTVPGFAGPFSVGPADESAQMLLGFTVTQITSTGGLTFATAPAIDVVTGNLTYQAALNSNGTATFSVTLRDSGPGAPAPNSNTSLTQTFTISVNAINDAPTFSIPAATSSNEDTDPISVPNFAFIRNTGPANESGQALVAFTLTPTGSTGGLVFATMPAMDVATGTLTYQIAPGSNGTATFDVTLTDNGLGAPAPNSNTSGVRTFIITVNSFNNAPTFTVASDPPTINEDAGLQVVPSFVAGMSAGPANEASQTLLGFTVTQIGTTGNVTFAPFPSIDVVTGNLTYQAIGNSYGTGTFSVTLRDSGPGAPAPNSNVSLPQIFTITVNPINDAPSFVVPANTSSHENAGLVSVPNFASNRVLGPANEGSQTPLGFTLTQLGSTGGLAFTMAPAIDPATGTLTYQAAPASSGTAAFSVVLTDSGPGSPLPNANSSAAQTFTITVDAVNDPPSFNLIGNPPAVNEDAGLQVVSGFAVNLSPGPSEETGQPLLGFSVTQTGSTGGLTFPVAPTIDLATGTLTYQAAANSNGTATFSVFLIDAGSSAAPSSNISAPRTFTIIVNPVNDAPDFNLPANPPASSEDAGLQTVNAFVSSIRMGPGNESSQALAAFLLTPTGTTGGLTFTIAPSINLATGVLTYQAAPEASGTASFDVVLFDNGSGSAPDVNTSGVKSFTIAVNSTNDAPAFTLAGPPTSAEDAGLQVVPGFATGMSAGPASESGQTLLGFSVIQVGATGGLTFASAPAINLATGNLTYQAAPDSYGTATFNLTLTDTGSGTAPNVNASTQTFTITVNAVNDAPTFALVGYPPSVNEDAGLQTLANFASSRSAGPTNESGQALTGFTLMRTSVTGGLTFASAPAINAATGALTYQPAANANGTATFEVTLSDSAGGVSGVQTFTITVNAINDAPTFTLSAGPAAVNEDAGPQSIGGFASAISTGSANESGQTLLGFTLTQISATGGLTFTAAPAINVATGELTYRTTPDASGSATFTVLLTDNGAAGPSPNINTSIVRTFTITVNPVNDAPTFTLAGDQSLISGAGLQVVPGFATGMGAGPANESGQTLAGFNVVLVNTTGSMAFLTAPTIDVTGKLTYLPTASAFGTATFNVTLSDNGPSAPAPNSNVSAVHTFTISERVGSVITATPSLANLNHGQAIDLAIVVRDSTAAYAAGTVTIRDKFSGVTTDLFTGVALSGGAANVNLGLLATGAHAIEVSYGGDSTTAPSVKVINVTVSPATNSTILTASGANPSVFGTPVHFTAVVSVTSSGTPGTITGSVSFLVGGMPIGTVSMPTSTTATTATYDLDFAGLTVNTTMGNAITATFLGSNPSSTATQDFAASAPSNTVLQKVTTASAATTLAAASPTSPSFYGQSVTFVATVTATNSPAFVSGGLVTFLKGSATLGTATVDSSGQASYTTTATQLAIGTASITAKYGGSPGFAVSTPSVPLAHTVQKAQTQTTLTSSLSAGSSYGQAVTFTASVSVTTGGNPGAVAGTVTFWDGTVSLGTVNVSGGVAKLTTSALKVNPSHAINAVFNTTSTSKFESSSDTISHAVATATTTTTLTASPAVWSAGQAITFTAKVAVTSPITSASLPGLPTGTVTFYVDGVAQAPVGVSSGLAKKAINFATVGYHTISAIYDPTANFAASSAAEQGQDVRKLATMTLTSSAPSGVLAGSPVTFTIKVTGAGAAPTGTVNLYDNGVLLASLPINSLGVAVFTTSTLLTGTHTILATYDGDVLFNPATRTISQVVKPKSVRLL